MLLGSKWIIEIEVFPKNIPDWCVPVVIYGQMEIYENKLNGRNYGNARDRCYCALGLFILVSKIVKKQ